MFRSDDIKKTVVLLSLCWLTEGSYASCQREDIDFYLEKGFTPDQITALCASTLANKSTDVADPKPSIAQPEEIQRPVTTDHTETLNLLRRSLKAEDIEIVDGVLRFSHRVKIKYGEEDVFGNLAVVKPRVQVTVKLATLRVVKVAKRIPLLRSATVLLTGDIGYQLIDQDQYTEQQREVIKTELHRANTENAVTVKLNKDASVDLVNFELQQLGEYYRQHGYGG